MDTRTDIPPPSSIVLDPRGRMTEVWWQFLLLLWRRTGGGSGGDLTKIIAEIADLATAAAGTAPDSHVATLLTRLNELEAAIAAEVVMLDRTNSTAAALEPVSVPAQSKSLDEGVLPSIPPRSDTGLGPVPTHGIHEDPDLHAVATPQRAGFMSAADKAKLDSL